MAQRVTGPVRKPRAGGIKDIVGSFVEESRLSVAFGAGAYAWEDATCGTDLAATRAGCYDTTPLEDKTGEGPTAYHPISDPFARYTGIECWLGGDNDGESYEAQSRRKFEGLEDRAVEKVLADWALAATSTASAATIQAAIGAADQAADQDYAGLPVILMSRDDADAAFAAGALVRQDGRLVTGNGTPVLATGTIAGGEIAVIGQPVVWASPYITAGAPDPTANNYLAITERVFAIGVDCDYRHTVTVTA